MSIRVFCGCRPPPLPPHHFPIARSHARSRFALYRCTGASNVCKPVKNVAREKNVRITHASGYSPSFSVVKPDCFRYGLAGRNEVIASESRKSTKTTRHVDYRFAESARNYVTGGERVLLRCSICRHQLSQTRTRKYSRCTVWRARLRVKGRKNKRCLDDVTEKYLGASHLRIGFSNSLGHRLDHRANSVKNRLLYIKCRDVMRILKIYPVSLVCIIYFCKSYSSQSGTCTAALSCEHPDRILISSRITERPLEPLRFV